MIFCENKLKKWGKYGESEKIVYQNLQYIEKCNIFAFHKTVFPHLLWIDKT